MNNTTAECTFAEIEIIREKYLANNCERWAPMEYKSNPFPYDHEEEEAERNSKRTRSGKKQNQFLYGNNFSYNNNFSYGGNNISYAQKASNMYDIGQAPTHPVSCNSTLTSHTDLTPISGNVSSFQLTHISESMKEFGRISEQLKNQMEDLKLQQKTEKENREKDMLQLKNTFEDNLNGLTNAFANRFKTSDEKLDNSFKSLNDTIKSMVMLQSLAREKKC